MKRAAVAWLLAAWGCGADGDGDGFLASVDCDDADPAVFPGASERCDGVDQDCDGEADLGALDALAAWTDADGDGAGDAALPVAVCALGAGHAAAPDDCDDADPARHPAAVETCDGVDQDCDGAIDEQAGDLQTFYADRDGDGHGDDAEVVMACALPLGAAVAGGDCDDRDATRYPGAAERCDAIDQDCDGDATLGAVDPATWYADADGDGFGDPGSTTDACAPESGWVADARDCDDLRPAVHPGADETCDGADEDCDGTVDEAAIDASLWFVDADLDGFGGASGAVLACEAPVGTAASVTDCDDTDPDVSPAGVEDCDDGRDNDCSGVPDDCELPALVRADAADVALDGRASAGYRAGSAVSSGADVDGDGLDEVLVGEKAVSGGAAGDVWLLYGLPTSGDLDTVGVLTVGDNPTGARFGEQVALVGDLDGDGFGDAMAAAPNDGYGTVHLRYGGPTRWSSGSVDVDWDAHWDSAGLTTGGTSTAALGSGLAGLGDMDGDGLAEVGFAAPYEGSYAGSAFLLPGRATRLSGTAAAMDLGRIAGQVDDHLGEDRGMAGGDLDGDGLADVAVGANGANADGVVYLLYSDGTVPTGVIAAATLPTVGETDPASTFFGRMVRIPGDLDGDGHADLVVGDPSNDALAIDGGAAWAFAGGPTRFTGATDVSAAFLDVRGTDVYACTGVSATGADLDQDGVVDLLLGSTQDMIGGPGEVGVFSLRSGTLREDDADLRLVGEASYSLFGSSVATGDLDADGLPDVVVGAAGVGGYDGRVYVFLGSNL